MHPKKQNKKLAKLIILLENQKNKIWKDTAGYLSGGTRRKVVVNLSHIDRFANEGDVILVPGVVLGSGELTKKITVSGFKISPGAKEKLEKSKSTFLSIAELLEKTPKGSGIKILR